MWIYINVDWIDVEDEKYNERLFRFKNFFKNDL